MKYIEAHMRIQYDGETDEQFRCRVTAMREHNDAMDRMAASIEAPMQVRDGWDCGCNQSAIHTVECSHKFCPRRPS